MKYSNRFAIDAIYNSLLWCNGNTFWLRFGSNTHADTYAILSFILIIHCPWKHTNMQTDTDVHSNADSCFDSAAPPHPISHSNLHRTAWIWIIHTHTHTLSQWLQSSGGNLLLSYQVVIWLKGVFNERKWFSEYNLKRIAEQTQAANRKTHFLLRVRWEDQCHSRRMQLYRSSHLTLGKKANKRGGEFHIWLRCLLLWHAVFFWDPTCVVITHAIKHN